MKFEMKFAASDDRSIIRRGSADLCPNDQNRPLWLLGMRVVGSLLRVTRATHTARVSCAELNVAAVFPAFEGVPLWPRAVQFSEL